MRTSSFSIPLVFSSGILTIFSLVMLGAISQEVMLNQLIFVIVGFVFFIIVSKVDYRFLTSSPWVWYFLLNILLVATFFLGKVVRGSARWIDIGLLQFQPSEFVKPLLILFLSSLIYRRKLASFKIFIQCLLIILLPVFLIYSQPDLSSSLIVFVTALVMMFASGASLKYFAGIFIPISLILPYIWGILKEYQKLRILSFIDPTNDPLGSGYNAIQSIVAVGSGMIFGRGLGHGTQSQLKFLPERQTDFIFAGIAEEFGFLGSLTLLLVYGWLLFTILKIARESRDFGGKLICIGVFVVLLGQLFINVGMNVGILPITGLTLPLVSAGGSSIIVTFVSLGLVGSVNRFQSFRKASLEIK